MILRILDRTGDTEVDMETDWDLAQTLFQEALNSGKMAFIKGEIQEQVFELSPDFETVVISAFAGG